MSSTITKAANGYSKQQSEADRLLHDLAETGRQIQPSERRFLKSIGRLAETGYRGDVEMTAMISKAKTVQQMRSAAGLNGEFEAAVEHADAVSVTNENVRNRLDKLANEMRVLQSEVDSINAQSAAACRVVERMEGNRSQLRLQQFLPADIYDDYNAAVREIAAGEQTELQDAEAELHECRLAIEFDGDIQSGSHKSAAHTSRVENVLRFAKQHGCVLESLEGRTIKTVINANAWAKLVSGKRQQLPTLENRVFELNRQHDAALAEADRILNFWLRPVPWSTKSLDEVLLGI